MDVLKYIESYAIKNKLLRMNYEFSAIEMAWLIWRNGPKYSLEQRHNDWRWIIDNVPDCAVLERMNCRKWSSLHDLIMNYIIFEKRTMEEFKRAGDNAVYSFAYKCDCDKEWTENFENAFGSLDKCIDAVLREMPEEKKITTIRKTYVDNNDYIKAEYDSNMMIYFIDKSDTTDEENELLLFSFEGMWFDFPTPFQHGDIVCDKQGSIYVLKSLPGWIGDPDNPKEVAFMKERFEQIWDVTDMAPIGYGVSKDGQIWIDGISKTYLELEFYTGPLEHEKRLLDALNRYIHKKLDIEQLTALQRKVFCEYLEKELYLENIVSHNDLFEMGFLEDI